MKLRSLENQCLMHRRIIERFDATDITGLSGMDLARFEAKYAEDSAPPVPAPVPIREPIVPVHQDPLFSTEEMAA